MSKLIEPVSWLDWVTLSYVCIVILLLSIGGALIFRNRNYAPLKERNVPGLITIAISGIIHTFATIIVNNHFPWLSFLEHKNCVFWNYWLQYFVGLGVWFTAITLRLVTYGGAFMGSVSDAGVRRIQKGKYILIPIIEGPLLIILIHFTRTQASYFDTSLDICTSNFAFKLALLLWVLFAAGTLIGILWVVHRAVERDYLSEVYLLWQIILVGLFIVCVNANLILFGLMNYKIARFLVTSNVGTLHLFTLCRLALYRLYKCLRSDSSYLDKFDETQNNYLIPVENFADFEESGVKIDAINKFLSYCRNQPILKIENESIDPNNLVDAYMELKMWHITFKRVREDKKYDDICERFILSGGKQYIPTPNSIKNPIYHSEKTSKTFAPFFKYIWDILEKNFSYGFLNSDRMITDDSDFFNYAEHNKIQKRLEGANLIHKFKGVTEVRNSEELETFNESITFDDFANDSDSLDSDDSEPVYATLSEFSPNYSSLTELREMASNQ